MRNAYAESSLFKPSSHTTASSSRRKVQRRTRIDLTGVANAWRPCVSQAAIRRPRYSQGGYQAGRLPKPSVDGGRVGRRVRPGARYLINGFAGGRRVRLRPEHGQKRERIDPRVACAHRPMKVRSGDAAGSTCAPDDMTRVDAIAFR